MDGIPSIERLKCMAGRPEDKCETARIERLKNSKPAATDFWHNHDTSARKSRITQAAATIFANNPNMVVGRAVGWAFKIEELVSERIDKEKTK